MTAPHPLDAIRANACGATHRQRLASRLIDQGRWPEGCTRLFTHNEAVDDINRQQLAKLGGKPHSFTMTAKGPEAEESDLKRRHHQGETVAAIAARLGRKPRAIRSRLKKLALI